MREDGFVVCQDGKRRTVKQINTEVADLFDGLFCTRSPEEQGEILAEAMGREDRGQK